MAFDFSKKPSMDNAPPSLDDASMEQYFQLLQKQVDEVAVQVDALALYLVERSDHITGVKRQYLEALFYVSNVNYEIRQFLDELYMASREGKFSNLDKYLTILIHECRTTAPLLINRLTRNATHEVNKSHVKAAIKQFNKDLTSLINDLSLESLLPKARNSAGAHHLDKSNDVGFLVQWHATSRLAWSMDKKFYENALVATAVYTCIYLTKLANVLEDADLSGYVNELRAYTRYAKLAQEGQIPVAD